MKGKTPEPERFELRSHGIAEEKGRELLREPLTFSTSALPEGASFDAGTRTFSWRPCNDQAGVYAITFSVTDNGSPPLGDSAVVTLTVTSRAYVLWTRSDTGRAVVWKIDPSSATGNPKAIPIADSAHLLSTTGVGRPWQATSYSHP